MSRLTVEICVEGLSSALAAGAGGADRVELCEHLAVGGVTPSAGAIALACRSLTIPVHVLIRPGGGDFVVSEVEFQAMRHDIATARSLGAAGVVLGVLRPDGTIDQERSGALIADARPMSVTFHRAFDQVPDPFEALETLIDLGVDRVLTSGQAESARLGISVLAELHARSAGRIIVLAGGRIRASDVQSLVAPGLSELHLGSAACEAGRTDVEAVRRIMKTVNECNHSDLEP
ncbi:copper homeostasis protein CutC [Tautonia rosea]|uniref:copper homeostasis protein CutC n=1 Tax=Tautonia rosea TaxID=2728037 RepID=UPI0014730E90|nr:copper homeostasis protein CutC [Tautonia rosea]